MGQGGIDKMSRVFKSGLVVLLSLEFISFYPSTSDDDDDDDNHVSYNIELEVIMN